MNSSQMQLMPQDMPIKVPTPGVSRSFEAVLKTIFPTGEDEARLQQARRIMGGAVDSLSDEVLDSHLTEFQYLIDSWLDEFERQSFAGRTLRQVIRGE